MADLWIPNAEVSKFFGRGGFGYDRTTRKKICLHTTEGGSIQGALNAYKKYPPHLITSLKERKTLQHVPLNKASYSLKGTESEDEAVIQVEIVGFAKEARNWSKEQLDWIVDEIMVPVHRMWPYELQGPPQGFKDEKDGIVLASRRSPIRFSMNDWINFSGIVGHQHAPDPDTHWDPGAVNVAYLISETKKKLGQSTPQAPAPAKDKPVAVKPSAEHISKMNEWFPIVFDRNADSEGGEYWAGVMATSGWTTAFNGLRDSFEGKFRDAVRMREIHQGMQSVAKRVLGIETAITSQHAELEAQIEILTALVKEMKSTIDAEVTKPASSGGGSTGGFQAPEELVYRLQ